MTEAIRQPENESGILRLLGKLATPIEAAMEEENDEHRTISQDTTYWG